MKTDKHGGYIYILDKGQSPSVDVKEAKKMGATGDPKTRLSVHQTSNLNKCSYQLLLHIENANCFKTEKLLQNEFKNMHVENNGGTEFFNINENIVKETLDNLDIEYRQVILGENREVPKGLRDPNIFDNDRKCYFCPKTFPTKHRYDKHMTTESLCIKLCPDKWARFLKYEESILEESHLSVLEPVSEESEYELVDLDPSTSSSLSPPPKSLTGLSFIHIPISIPNRCVFCNKIFTNSKFKEHKRRKRTCKRITEEQYRLYQTFEDQNSE